MSFNSKIDSQAAALTERSGIEILSFSIIYELTDKVKELLKEREPKTEVEEVTGAAKILKIFNTSKGKQVIGGRVTTGTIEKNSSVKIMRREAEIGDGKIKELQHAKVATSSVQEGEEFGAMIESKLELVPGDMIQAVTKVVK
jgi:translation initiation factor IF-2